VKESFQNKCKNHDYGAQHRFWEAVRVDMEYLREKSVTGTKSSTLALITVSFEDVVEAITNTQYTH
jgi:hypothetical protein